MQSGIYKIENKVNSKVYIGSAVNIPKRWREHRHYLSTGTAADKFQKAWNKYGAENFVFSVVEYVENDQLILREQYWIGFYDAVSNGYNTCLIASSSLGLKRSKETKEKLRLSHLGKKLPPEQVKKIIKKLTGRPVSAETREKISKSNIGKNKGRVITTEWRKKISEGCKRNSVGKWMVGKKLSRETREKIGRANIGRVHPPVSEVFREKCRLREAKKREQKLLTIL